MVDREGRRDRRLRLHGNLTTWTAAVKIAVDPLLYAYQKLGMLIADAPGTVPTVYLSLGIEELPLLDRCAELVVCRNALDHVPAPKMMLDQIHRILKPRGYLFLSVDIGGSPTPDEPTVFTIDSLTTLVGESFTIVSHMRTFLRTAEADRARSGSLHESRATLCRDSTRKRC